MERNVSHCPVCAEDVNVNVSEQTINCPRCDVPHHEICWRYNAGRCAVYACGGDVYIVSNDRPRRNISSIVSRNYSSGSRGPLEILPGILFALCCASVFGLAFFALYQMSPVDRQDKRPIYPYDRPYVIEEYRRGR